MSQTPALDWAILAVSLFNTVVLLWLGLTVLLNARRKNWGVWLAGGGLLLGGLFFVSHTVLLWRGLDAAAQALNAWWVLGWAAVIASPYLWYVVMLWYAGYWDDPGSDLRRRQRAWFFLTTALSAALATMLLFVYPLPSLRQVVLLDLAAAPSVAGIPVLLLVYPAYILLCIGLSLHALRHSSRETPARQPPASGEWINDRARQRARARLRESTLTLLAVSLLVAWAMAWIVANARAPAQQGLYPSMPVTLAWFDLAIASLIALAVVSLGQAIVAYEIFTGEALPRRGFARQWRALLWLAAGYGALVGWSLVAPLRPVYLLLAATALVVVLPAVFGWRAFAERERYIAHLRPFVSSQRLYDSLLAPSPEAHEVDVSALFDALCRDVLAIKGAYLVTVGPLAPLIGPGLAFPRDRTVPRSEFAAESAAEFAAGLDASQRVCAPLDPAQNGGMVWAVPLWSERGLIGMLFLGEKRDGGLYTREEIEIARASGERLLDTLATAQVSGRLMALLRQRIAQVRVLEGQGRRALHDQVLPQLHAAILHLGGLPDEPAALQAVEALTAAHRQISDLMRDTASTEPRLLAEQGLLAALRASLEGEFEGAFDGVTWQSTPEAVQVVGGLPLYVTEVLFFAALELIRNAARHGRGGDPQRPLQLAVALEASSLAVTDDGVGFGAAPPEDAATGGRNGLRFHSTMLAAVGGSLEVVALPGGGTRAAVRFPHPLHASV